AASRALPYRQKQQCRGSSSPSPQRAILAMIWLWRDTGDSERIAALAQGTFFLVLPTLPFFLVLPPTVAAGIGVFAAMVAVCLVTVALYLLVVWLLPKLGVSP